MFAWLRISYSVFREGNSIQFERERERDRNGLRDHGQDKKEVISTVGKSTGRMSKDDEST